MVNLKAQAALVKQGDPLAGLFAQLEAQSVQEFKSGDVAIYAIG